MWEKIRCCRGDAQATACTAVGICVQRFHIAAGAGVAGPPRAILRRRSASAPSSPRQRHAQAPPKPTPGASAGPDCAVMTATHAAWHLIFLPVPCILAPVVVADDVSQRQEQLQEQQQNNERTLGGRNRKRWTPAAAPTVAPSPSRKTLRDSPDRKLADTPVGGAGLRAADSNDFEESASEDGMRTAVCHHLIRCLYTCHYFPRMHSTPLHHICCLQCAHKLGRNAPFCEEESSYWSTMLGLTILAIALLVSLHIITVGLLSMGCVDEDLWEEVGDEVPAAWDNNLGSSKSRGKPVPAGDYFTVIKGCHPVSSLSSYPIFLFGIACMLTPGHRLQGMHISLPGCNWYTRQHTCCMSNQTARSMPQQQRLASLLRQHFAAIIRHV